MSMPMTLPLDFKWISDAETQWDCIQNSLNDSRPFLPPRENPSSLVPEPAHPMQNRGPAMQGFLLHWRPTRNA